MQYILSSVPDHLDRELQRRAAAENKDVEQVIVESLERALQTPQRHTDLDHLAGIWEDDPEFERALADFERIDEGHSSGTSCWHNSAAGR